MIKNLISMKFIPCGWIYLYFLSWQWKKLGHVNGYTCVEIHWIIKQGMGRLCVVEIKALMNIIDVDDDEKLIEM